MNWDIQPGTTILRRTLHDRFGGGRQGGIEPSAKSKNVFLFSDKEVGAEFGYNFDGWHSDGTFHYTGEGKLLDQVMTHGNRAVRDHLLENRALRLFEKRGTSVLYVGEFEVPNDSHVLVDESPDKNGDLRSVFVFRLRPVGDNWRDPELNAPSESLTRTIALEAHNAETYLVNMGQEETTIATRVEAELVARYVTWLQLTTNATVERNAIATAAGHLMYTDLFVRDTLELIEAKASSSRSHIRSALGQILDYARYVTHATLAVLTPTEPTDEMKSLLLAHGVSSIWETPKKGTFLSTRVANEWSTS